LFLKEPARNSVARGSTPEVRATVESVIADIRERGDEAVREYSAKFDKHAPESFLLSQEQLDEIMARVPEQVIEDIKFVQQQVRVMAQKQLESLSDFEIETLSRAAGAHAGGTATASEAPATPRAGVKVPLPEGWSAQLAADGSFQAGPRGRPVLRVDIRPGQAAAFLDTEALADEVPARFKGFAVSLDAEDERSKDFSLVRVTLALLLPDGGHGRDVPALFAAKRMGPDLFLCATLPGASAEEVRLASDACRRIELQPAPR
jgi:hypothetical protein